MAEVKFRLRPKAGEIEAAKLRSLGWIRQKLIDGIRPYTAKNSDVTENGGSPRAFVFLGTGEV